MQLDFAAAMTVTLALAGSVCADDKEAAAPGTQIATIFSAAESLAQQGNLTEAQQRLREAVSLQRAATGRGSAELIPILDRLAVVQAAIHDRLAVVETRREIRKLLVDAHGQQHHRVRTAEHTLKVAEAVAALSDQDYALVEASRAKLKDGIKQIANLNTLEGSRLLNEAYDELKSKCGATCLECRLIRETQHALFRAMERSDVVLEVARRDEDVIRATFGADSPEYAALLCTICMAEFEVSQFEAAERDTIAAIRILKATDDGDSDLRESMLKMLSVRYSKTDRLAEAESLAVEQRELADRRAPGTVDQAEAMKLQAALALRRKDFNRAIELLAAAIQIMEKNGEHGVDLAFLQQQLGGAFQDIRRLKEAEPMLKAALETYRNERGVSDPQTILVSRRMAKLHVEQEQWESAVDLLKPLYRLVRSRLGADNAHTVEFRDLLVQSLRALKRDAEADELLREPRPFVVPAAGP